MLKNATRCIKSQGYIFEQDDGDVYIFIILFYMLISFLASEGQD